MKTQENSLTTVYISNYMHQIYIAKSKLALYNIEAFVFDENLNSIIGTSFIEGYKLKVRARDFEQAKTILSLEKT